MQSGGGRRAGDVALPAVGLDRREQGHAAGQGVGRVIFGMDGVTQAGAGLGLPLRMRGVRSC